MYVYLCITFVWFFFLILCIGNLPLFQSFIIFPEKDRQSFSTRQSCHQRYQNQMLSHAYFILLYLYFIPLWCFFFILYKIPSLLDIIALYVKTLHQSSSFISSDSLIKPNIFWNRPLTLFLSCRQWALYRDIPTTNYSTSLNRTYAIIISSLLSNLTSFMISGVTCFKLVFSTNKALMILWRGFFIIWQLYLRHGVYGRDETGG